MATEPDLFFLKQVKDGELAENSIRNPVGNLEMHWFPDFFENLRVKLQVSNWIWTLVFDIQPKMKVPLGKSSKEMVDLSIDMCEFRRDRGYTGVVRGLYRS